MVKILIATIIGILIERIANFEIIIPIAGISAAVALMTFLYVKRKHRISHRRVFLRAVDILWNVYY